MALLSPISKISQQVVILKNIQKLKSTITTAKEQLGSSDQLEIGNLDDLLYSIQVFEAEIFWQRQEWDKLLGVINVRM